MTKNKMYQQLNLAISYISQFRMTKLLMAFKNDTTELLE